MSDTHTPPARRPSGRGFSVTELLTVLAIMGMMIAISGPAMLNFFQAMKVRTASQRMVSHVRLCRQISVSRRDNVTMVIEGNGLPPSYSAWEDKVVDQAMDANGEDDVANNDDDEVWVVKTDLQMRGDAIRIVDCFNDTTPTDPLDSPGSSIMVSNQLKLRFYPDGTVVRLNDQENPVTTDTLIRIRIEGNVGRQYVDRWDVTLNRAGKVDTNFYRYEQP